MPLDVDAAPLALAAVIHHVCTQGLNLPAQPTCLHGATDLNINKLALAALISAPFTCPAIAQDLPDLLDHLTVVKGDVSSKGGIGLGTQGGVRFLPEGQISPFPAELAVDRDTLKRINENCSFNEFYFTEDNLCSATIRAEVSLDGSRINLLIFDVQDLQPPKEKN